MEEAISMIEDVWMERNFRNTFRGSPSRAFFRAIQIAIIQYTSPGPKSTDRAIFDPTPLMDRVDGLIKTGGGLNPENREFPRETLKFHNLIWSGYV